MNRAFTLIELVIVVSTVALLACLVLSAVFSLRTKAGQTSQNLASAVPVALH